MQRRWHLWFCVGKIISHVLLQREIDQRKWLLLAGYVKNYLY